MNVTRQSIQKSVELSPDRIPVKAIAASIPEGKQAATAFQLFKNPDQTAKFGIEAEMKQHFIWVVFPKGTKVMAGWNTVNRSIDGFGEPRFYDSTENRGLYEAGHFSEAAAEAVRKGEPVAAYIRYMSHGNRLVFNNPDADWIKFEIEGRELDYAARVVLVNSDPISTQTSSNWFIRGIAETLKGIVRTR